MTFSNEQDTCKKSRRVAKITLRVHRLFKATATCAISAYIPDTGHGFAPRKAIISPSLTLIMAVRFTRLNSASLPSRSCNFFPAFPACLRGGESSHLTSWLSGAHEY